MVAVKFVSSQPTNHTDCQRIYPRNFFHVSCLSIHSPLPPGKPRSLKVTQLFPEEGNLGLVLPTSLCKWTTDMVRKEGVTVLPGTTVAKVALAEDGKVEAVLSDGSEASWGGRSEVSEYCLSCWKWRVARLFPNHRRGQLLSGCPGWESCYTQSFSALHDCLSSLACCVNSVVPTV